MDDDEDYHGNDKKNATKARTKPRKPKRQWHPTEPTAKLYKNLFDYLENHADGIHHIADEIAASECQSRADFIGAHRLLDFPFYRFHSCCFVRAAVIQSNLIRNATKSGMLDLV
jgi:hypothetical protein